jgi:hypothetical protein
VENTRDFIWKPLKDREQLEDFGVDERVILKGILKK